MIQRPPIVSFFIRSPTTDRFRLSYLSLSELYGTRNYKESSSINAWSIDAHCELGKRVHSMVDSGHLFWAEPILLSRWSGISTLVRPSAAVPCFFFLLSKLFDARFGLFQCLLHHATPISTFIFLRNLKCLLLTIDWAPIIFGEEFIQRAKSVPHNHCRVSQPVGGSDDADMAISYWHKKIPT